MSLMYLNIKKNNNCNLVKEYCNSIINEIDENKKIILSGTSKCGQSTILSEYQKTTDKNNNALIIPEFKKTSKMLTCLNKENKNYYFELIMSDVICESIKNNNINLYTDKYQKFHFFIKNNIEKLYENIVYEKELKEVYDSFELVEELIKQMKLDYNKIILCVDHFDCIQENAEYNQRKIESYFFLFDKVILTTNDEQVLANDNVKNHLINNDYHLKIINYALEKDTAVAIMNDEFNKKMDANYSISDYLNKNRINQILTESNGNIEELNFIINELLHINNNLNRMKLDKNINLNNDLPKVFQKLRIEKRLEKKEKSRLYI